MGFLGGNARYQKHKDALVEAQRLLTKYKTPSGPLEDKWAMAVLCRDVRTTISGTRVPQDLGHSELLSELMVGLKRLQDWEMALDTAISDPVARDARRAIAHDEIFTNFAGFIGTLAAENTMGWQRLAAEIAELLPQAIQARSWFVDDKAGAASKALGHAGRKFTNAVADSLIERATRGLNSIELARPALAPSAVVPAIGTGDVALLLKQLKELRDAGVLTEAEYQSKVLAVASTV